jgi:hypothetical protein
VTYLPSIAYDRYGAPRVTLESLEALREEDRRLERSVQLLSKGLELVEMSQRELSDKVADGLTGLAETLRSCRAETDRIRREGIERRRYWLNIVIVLISCHCRHRRLGLANPSINRLFA